MFKPLPQPQSILVKNPLVALGPPTLVLPNPESYSLGSLAFIDISCIPEVAKIELTAKFKFPTILIIFSVRSLALSTIRNELELLPITTLFATSYLTSFLNAQ